MLVLDGPAEQTLALLLTRFGEVVDEVGGTLQPHRLCATSMSCPVRWRCSTSSARC